MQTELGRWWITDQRHEGADIEGFLDRELQRYAPSLTSTLRR